MPTAKQPRVAVITGASSGLGLVAAKALATEGWRIIGQGRNPNRISDAAEQIRAVAKPGVRVDMLRADLSLVSDSARLADEITKLTDRVDVLLNNAGGAAKAQEITSEGNEVTFASNHLGHFVITDRLLPLLKAAAAQGKPGDTRIINVSSIAHAYAAPLDFGDLQTLRGEFVPIKAYSAVKLVNVLFTRSLAERLADSGIVAHAVHPGAVDTNFVDRADAGTQAHMRSRELLTPEQGADTLIWLALAPEVGQSTGLYWTDRQATQPSAAALDQDAADQLWRQSEALVAAASHHAKD